MTTYIDVKILRNVQYIYEINQCLTGIREQGGREQIMKLLCKLDNAI